MRRSKEEAQKDAEAEQAAHARLIGSLLYTALREGGRKAIEQKAREKLKDVSGEEIQAMSVDWREEIVEALAEFFSKDERFR